MNATPFMLRIWPRLLRALHNDQSLHACTVHRTRPHFTPMAILLDEAQAYKPTDHTSAQALHH